MSIDKIQEMILAKIEAKYWDFPYHINFMKIVSYDTNDNPLVIEYYKGNDLKFTHTITYDSDGRVVTKKITIPNN